jgi:hypothetical protein
MLSLLRAFCQSNGRVPRVASRRRTRHRRPAVECLEERSLLAALSMSDAEQLMVELVNHARANPAAEAARYGIELNEGLPPGVIISPDPKQPLAPNQILLNVAASHTQWMLDTDQFTHEQPVGTPFWVRINAAGYDGTLGENLGAVWTTGSYPSLQTDVLSLHRNLFLSPGHRENMLEPAFEEVGVGVRRGLYPGTANATMVTENFGSRGDGPFLTGVAYSDQVVAGDFFTPGEGLQDVTIMAVGAGATVYTTTTGPTGGYALQVPAGTYTVRAMGGELGGTVVVRNVTVGATNVKVDFQPPGVLPAADIAGRYTNGDWWVAKSDGATFTNQRWTGWAATGWNDARVADVSGDGLADIVGRYTNGDWWVAKSDGTQFLNARWGYWSPIAWQDLQVADVNGDGLADVVGRCPNGDWWVARSTGAQFVNERWGSWAPIAWQDVQLADVNGDGRSDLVGRAASGDWWVARSTGTQFVNERWGSWSPIPWHDVQAADVNGDGRSDLVGRTDSGQWWVARSTGTALVNDLWGTWAASGWHDVQTADVNRDGRDDLVGRYDNGQWWVARSTGTALVNELWGSWEPTGWTDVRAAAFSTTPHSLLAADGAALAGADSPELAADQAAAFFQEALARWAAAGTPDSAASAWAQTQVVVTDLPGAELGRAWGDTIYLDRDAAGHGWWIDATPGSDEEFGGLADGGQLRAMDPQAAHGIDLLTVLEHELGHLAGAADLAPTSLSLMASQLPRGIRRVVTPSEVDAFFERTLLTGGW